MRSIAVVFCLLLTAGLFLCISDATLADTFGTAFSYQGRLVDGEEPADGPFDFMFTLYDEAEGGSPLAGTIDINDLDVVDGYFTTALDFGTGVFDGNACWLEVSIRPGESTDTADFLTLSPRSRLLPVPYALYAASGNPGPEGDPGPPGPVGPKGEPGDSHWLLSGKSTYYDAGFVGIGNPKPDYALDIEDDNPFVRLQRDPNALAGIRWDEVGAARTQWIFPFIRGWQSDNLIVRDEAAPRDTMTFEALTGNVGIGTSTPAARLDVDGTVKAAAFQGNGSLITDVNGTWDQESNWYSTSGQALTTDSYVHIYKGNTLRFWNASDALHGNIRAWMSQLRISADSGGDVAITSDAGEGLIVKDSARVGIGTTDPGSQLEISGVDPLLFINTTGALAGLKLRQNSKDEWTMAWNSGSKYLYFYEHGGGTRMVISDQTGNVGIGTASPTQKLEVNGTVKAAAFAGSGAALTGVPGAWDLEDNAYSNTGKAFATANFVHIYDGALRFWNETNALRGNIYAYTDRLHISADSGGDVEVVADSGDGIIVKDSGQVGIKTKEPTASLDVRAVAGEAYVSVDGGATGLSGYRINENGQRRWLLFFRQWQGDNLIVRDEAGSRDTMTFESGTGNVGIGTSSPSGYRLAVNGSAAKPGGGSWSSFSDERLKDLKGTFSRGLEEVAELTPLNYTYSADNPLDLPHESTFVGAVAQQVKKVIPEAVQTDENGYLMVNNDPIIWATVNAVKQLKTENEMLRKQNQQLENRLAALENALLTRPEPAEGVTQ